MLLLSRVKRVLITKPEFFLLLIAGFILRIVGTKPGYYAHGDELMYGEAVYMLLNKTLGMEPHILGFYPPLVAWIMLAAFVFVFIPTAFISQIPLFLANMADFGSLLGDQTFSNFLNIFILGENWSNAVYWGRYTTVVFATAIIALSYKLSEKIFKKRLAAFLCALFITVNYRLILNSKIGFLDIYSVFFLLLSLLLILQLYEKPNLKNYLFAWFSVGLSFLVKYQIYTGVALIGIHFLISMNLAKRNIRKFLRVFLSKGFLLGGILTFLLVLISHYYHFLNWEKVVGMFEYQALKYGLGVNSLSIFPISYIYHVALGPISSFSAIFGLTLCLTNKKYRLAAILIGGILATVSYIYFYYSTGGTYTRNLLVVIPLALIFSGYFFSWLYEKIMTPKKNKALKFLSVVTLFILILFPVNNQLRDALVATGVLTKTSGQILAQKWVQEIVPKDSHIGVYIGGFSPNEKNYTIKTFTDLGEALSLKELANEGLDYQVFDLSWITGSFVWWMGQPTNIGLKFWNKPDNLLSQSYNALAARELLWKALIVSEPLKWQISGYNYAIFKVFPESFSGSMSQIETYKFNNNETDWVRLTYFNELEKLLVSDGEQLTIRPESIKPGKIRTVHSRPGTFRWSSETIPIKPGYLYSTTGKIHNASSLEKLKRNGFLRLDFYSTKPHQSFDSRPIVTFVSQRVYGQSSWHEVEASGIAPSGSKYMTVGFQADFPETEFSLDEIRVQESKDRVEDSYPHSTVSDDDFFPPNDGGFL